MTVVVHHDAGTMLSWYLRWKINDKGRAKPSVAPRNRVLQKPSGSVVVEADKAAKRFLSVAGSKLGSIAESTYHFVVQRRHEGLG